MKVVSIVMPYYNTSLYIKEAVLSILAQSYKDWELLIVDDCSTESKTRALLNEIASLDERIVIIRTENAGLRAGLPAAVSSAHRLAAAFILRSVQSSMGQRNFLPPFKTQSRQSSYRYVL